MAAILEVSDVHQKFRSGFWMKPTHVLKGVSLEVPKGSVFGFLGANGAGKTTLIHLMIGLRRPTAGSIRFQGIDAVEAAARSRMGYLPERPYFHEHLTGEELLKYFGALSGLSGSGLKERITKVLSIVGMTHARDVKLRRYSKGMLQRIGIAQAILHDPEFLVFDEPMSGLDPIGRKEIRELIEHLASDGKTIFFSTHVIPDVEAVCDQVALIQKGRLIGCGPVGKFLSQGAIATEIAFNGVSADQIAKLDSFKLLREASGGYLGTASDSEAVSRILRQLLEMNAQILSVSPIRPSLESVFDANYEVGK